MPRHPQEHGWLVRLATFGRSEIPVPPDPDRDPTPPRRLEVFAVGPDWVQLTWSALGPGPVTLAAGDTVVEVTADGGPGAALVGGLDSGRPVVIEVRAPGIDGALRLGATTLTPPPGEELLRVATVSDVHVGSHSTGYLHTIVELPEPDELHPLRCLRAATAELAAWGAQHVVVKGDLVDRSIQANWDLAAEVLGELPLPVELLPGNHERSGGDVDAGAALAAMGLSLADGVATVDHAGVRIVTADTVRAGTEWGTVDAVADALVDAVDVDQPVLVAIHHQVMRYRLPTYLPVGIPGPSGRALLGRLGRTNPRILVTSGHTHRHRRHEVAGVTATEVGSTKDFPGSWAGYHVHEGGVMQIVRRIAEPSCIRWTDHTRRAAAGVWAHWSPGTLADRCFTRSW